MRIQNRHVVTHETYASVNLVMRIKAALDLKEAVRLAFVNNSLYSGWFGNLNLI